VNIPFEFYSFETLISKKIKMIIIGKYWIFRQRKGNSTPRFIIPSHYGQINHLDELLENKTRKIEWYWKVDVFSWKVILKNFNSKRPSIKHHSQEISTATASRDLKNGFENGLIEKFGDVIKQIIIPFNLANTPLLPISLLY